MSDTEAEMHPHLPAPHLIPPAEARAAFDSDLRFLRDHPEERGLIHQAMYRWYAIFQQATGIDAFDYNGSPDIALPNGIALGSSGAAFCLLEAQRTAVFLRGIENAIHDLQQRFPGERIRVLYAGCGPYATLLTPLASRFTAEEVGWYLLEVNPTSLDSVHRLYQALELEPYLLGTQLADASHFTLPDADRFHLVLSETMQRALQNETQLAITLNLLPQLDARAIFLPERIAVRAELLRYTESSDQVPQATFQFLKTLYELGPRPAAPPHEVHCLVPELASPGRLTLTTEVQVYKEETLSGNDTAITLPKDMHLRLHGGEHLVFNYQWQPRPGFNCVIR